MGRFRRVAVIALFAFVVLRSNAGFILPAKATGSLCRREGLLALVAGVAFQAEGVSALNDARQDSICTYKCLAICNQKAPDNEEYCQKACKLYCQSSQAEQDLDSNVKKGSIVDKILDKSRKKKFDANRADNSKTEKLDLFIGGQLSLSNVTDYANGIKETAKIKEFMKQ
ncbi:unnamed protein product [Durusdinium trenchii]|uniref:Uncharacterized protein n=1 Tax=Durusdinium trenchii TaxID=1381693 RepID=A0ABP0JQ65_9DINO